MKRGRGRPKLPKALKRTYVIPMRFNAMEIERIENAAKKRTMNRLEWLRDVLAFLSSPDLFTMVIPKTLPDGSIKLRRYTA